MHLCRSEKETSKNFCMINRLWKINVNNNAKLISIIKELGPK